jgi:hypothetical protein
VADFEAMVGWYGRLLGREPDMRPHDAEACWKLTDSAWLYVLEDSERRGGDEATIMVDRLDAELAAIARRGIEPEQIEEYPGKARKASIVDPEGNRIGIGQPLG